METRSGFVGSMDLTSTKLKQTVNLNRRTVHGLDCALTRFEREKTKNTSFISREKEKFLAKQSRILPHITTPAPKPVNKTVTKLRPKSSVSIVSCCSLDKKPLLINRENTLPANILLKKKNTENSPKKTDISPLWSPITTRRDSTPNYKTEKLKLQQIENKRIRSTTFPSNTNVQTSHYRQSKTPSPENIKSTTFATIDVSETVIGNWDKLKTKMDYLMYTVEENDISKKFDNSSEVYEQLQGCRYIRRTKEQRYEFENIHECKTCYCNSCSIHKSSSSPRCSKKF